MLRHKFNANKQVEAAALRYLTSLPSCLPFPFPLHQRLLLSLGFLPRQGAHEIYLAAASLSSVFSSVLPIVLFYFFGAALDEMARPQLELELQPR